MAVIWLWSGATTDTSVTVAVKAAPGDACQVIASTSPSLTISPRNSIVTAADSDGFVKLTVTGLTANTTWYYGVKIGGVLDAMQGQFRTLPTPGPTSFSMGFASCSIQTNNHPVYDRIADRADDLTLFMHLGDFHYEGALETSAAAYRTAYADAFALSKRKAWHQKMAIPYVWDDHDWGASNDGDRTWPNAEDAAAVYRQIVPHYPLVPVAPDNAIYHTFTIGRCPFIVTDLRYHRDPSAAADSPAHTAMGATQKQWFKDQLVAARDAGAPLVFWCSSSVWSLNGDGSSGADTWGRFAYERAELATFIEANNIPPVVILSGDAHQLSYHPGRLFGTGQRAIPEHVSAAMAADPATRFGPWAFGPLEGSGHYSTLDVTDDGTTVSYTVTGWAVDGAGVETQAYTVTDNSWGGGGTSGSGTGRTLKVHDGTAWVPRRVSTHDGAWTPHLVPVS